ncbi:MAG: helix-turn-helix domain-containing protein [Deltaproteobacteria bacterium]|nr:helix-turn-helix domain-containing protein [Deltaproteobacteria bacterium]
MESPRADGRSREALFLLRPAEVAALLRLNRNTIYRWLRQGTLTRIRLGGSTFVNGQELLDRLAVVRERPAGDPALRSRARALLQELQERGTRSSASRSA